jgi:hypothetical protein
LREGQIDGRFVPLRVDKKDAYGLNFHPKRRRSIDAHS